MSLYLDVPEYCWPIVYRNEYNIHFIGLEKCHPFDAQKWKNVIKILKLSKLVQDDNIVKPNEITTEDLLRVHTKRYLDSLKWSFNVAKVVEVLPVALVPNFLAQSAILRPMRYQTGGSVLAGKLAVERGWAINIGGGFHHCSGDRGGGFCAYADITLMIHFLRKTFGDAMKKVMIVDLDAHQGNGYATDFLLDKSVYIMDVYNRAIYPNDVNAKAAIRRPVELKSYTKDAEYLRLVNINLNSAFNEFSPNILVYNAGTDILEGDPLGRLSITREGVTKRDEMIFKKAQSQNVPIVMLLSGGYTRISALVIADSILNLAEQGIIQRETTKK